MELERRGIPTVTLFTQAFDRLSVTVVRGRGMPDLPRVILPHPLNPLPEAEIREIVRRNIGQIVKHMTQEARHPAR